MKMFKCTQCQDTFDDKLARRRHMRKVHTKVRNDNIIRVKNTDNQWMSLFNSGLCPLSNCYLAPFAVCNSVFRSVEQYYQAEKCKHANDYQAFCQVMSTWSPSTAKHYGRAVKGYDKKAWLKTCDAVMEMGIREKIRQHPSIEELLLQTESDVIAEVDKHDTYWSNGMDLAEPNINDMTKWTGKNKLGQILMKIRDEIKAERKM